MYEQHVNFFTLWLLMVSAIGCLTAVLLIRGGKHDHLDKDENIRQKRQTRDTDAPQKERRE